MRDGAEPAAARRRRAGGRPAPSAAVVACGDAGGQAARTFSQPGLHKDVAEAAQPRAAQQQAVGAADAACSARRRIRYTATAAVGSSRC